MYRVISCLTVEHDFRLVVLAIGISRWKNGSPLAVLGENSEIRVFTGTGRLRAEAEVAPIGHGLRRAGVAQRWQHPSNS